MPDVAVQLNHTVRAAGRDVRVPITYEKQGSHFIFHAPLYKLRVVRQSRTMAWKEFSDKLNLAVEQSLKARL